MATKAIIHNFQKFKLGGSRVIILRCFWSKCTVPNTDIISKKYKREQDSKTFEILDHAIVLVSMGLYEYVSVSMGLNESLWGSMSLYGSLCVSMGLYESVFVSMGLYGPLWVSMVLHGLLLMGL